ncbi:MAG: ligase protein [Candidatus Nomurabacteria bacterium GW2011_GWB1_37_5]|uniref:DNA ligase n=1 Tax=Candidatus Nomurabacteria bacterium GW2011_GWB1_37_5 TaxID=1618742 RepID=A0A0G0H929_9BACT|nr:MAG: ligase protein [Candidatus Nomurabacteria bacterium GW2011_GWB1_37_5]
MGEKKQIKERILKLCAQITDLRYRYHVLNDPTVTDEIYDSLTRELRKLGSENPEFLDIVNSIDRVAGKPLDKFIKVAHTVPMLSLNDIFSTDELNDWEKRITKLLPAAAKLSYFSELKYDGLAVSLIYEKGQFVRGATRGDGKIGEDITENLKMIENLPLKLKAPYPNYIEVRGEAVMSKAVFERLNKKNEREDKAMFANTRNAAAGSLRQLDSKLTKERHLDFFAYDIAEIKWPAERGPTSRTEPRGRTPGSRLITHSDKHKLLREFGFVTGEYEAICSDLDEVNKFIGKVSEIRPKYPYGTDGVVISVDNLDLQNVLGVVGKAPRYMAAYKYPAEKATTIVKEIRINVGRTGVLTPLAVFEPTLVAGSTISKATLHNMDQIERLDIRMGDTVVIQKAGDVIPEVVEVLPKMRTGKEKKFKMPEKCPVCGAQVERRTSETKAGKRSVLEEERSDGKGPTSRRLLNDLSTQSESVAYYCSNPKCPAKNRRGMQHFVNILEIYEVGPKVLDRFKDEGLISDAADLFTLKKEDIAGLERFGEKSADNILASIESHKKIPLWRFIYALGILHVGEQTAKDLAEQFGSYKKIKSASFEKFGEIENIGPVVAKSVYEFFQQKENINFIDKLFKNRVRVLKGEKRKVGKFSGFSFVITGTLSSMSREKAKEEILNQGGRVGSAVSKETDYLVVGEEPGSKLKEAQKLGVKTLSEAEFLKML